MRSKQNKFDVRQEKEALVRMGQAANGWIKSMCACIISVCIIKFCVVEVVSS